MAAISVEERRSYIKIVYFRVKSGKEIHKNLCEACGNNALSFKIVYRWLEPFSAGKTDILDEARSGRPHEATDPYQIEKSEGSP